MFFYILIFVRTNISYISFISRGYLIVAPRTVRAESVYSVHASIYKMYSKNTYIRVTLSQNGEEYANGITKFQKTGSQLVELLVSEQAWAPYRRVTYYCVVGDF